MNLKKKISPRFVAELKGRGFKPTTQKIYLTDVAGFVKYILSMSPSSERLE